MAKPQDIQDDIKENAYRWYTNDFHYYMMWRYNLKKFEILPHMYELAANMPHDHKFILSFKNHKKTVYTVYGHTFFNIEVDNVS